MILRYSFSSVIASCLSLGLSRDSYTELSTASPAPLPHMRGCFASKTEFGGLDRNGRACFGVL